MRQIQGLKGYQLNDLTEKLKKAVVEEFLRNLTENFKKAGQVRIPNFGSFRVREYAARAGRNPKTGEIIQIPAHKKVVFRPHKSFADKVI